MVVGRNVLGRSVGNVGIQEMTGNGYVLGVATKFHKVPCKAWSSCMTNMCTSCMSTTASDEGKNGLILSSIS
jgi:hypothetical protein